MLKSLLSLAIKSASTPDAKMELSRWFLRQVWGDAIAAPTLTTLREKAGV